MFRSYFELLTDISKGEKSNDVFDSSFLIICLQRFISIEQLNGKLKPSDNLLLD